MTKQQRTAAIGAAIGIGLSLLLCVISQLPSSVTMLLFGMVIVLGLAGFGLIKGLPFLMQQQQATSAIRDVLGRAFAKNYTV